MIRAALTTALVAACSPAPAWAPGDGPLGIRPDTALAAETFRACEHWAAVGLRCVDSDDGMPVFYDPALYRDPDGLYAITEWQWSIEWHWRIRVRPDVTGDQLVRYMTHELGHALGHTWHTDRLTSVMARFPVTDCPDAGDIAALGGAEAGNEQEGRSGSVSRGPCGG